LGIIHRRGKELGSTTRRFIELLQNDGQNLRLSSRDASRNGELTRANRAELDKTSSPVEYQHNGHANGNGHHATRANHAPVAAESSTFPAERPGRVKAK